MRYVNAFGCAALALAAGMAQAGSVVTDWNQAALDAVKATSTAPPFSSRALAMTHTAVFDAVNSISATHQPYKFFESVPSSTSKAAAAAQAAHDVLVSLFPSQSASFGTLLSTQLGSIADGVDKSNGITLGSSIASGVIASRSGDGTNLSPTYTGGTNPGDWQPTPPAFSTTPLFQQFATSTPWTMTSGDQFRQGAPAALTSAEYTAAYNEVKELGRIDSATRTAEQTEIARLWAAGGGTVTPPGQWNKIAQQLSDSQGNTLEEDARMFALLNLSTADAAVVAWDMKAEYDLWRPVTGIRAGDTDGNPDTIGDADWTPLLNTPNFQAYVSGHSTFSGAAAEALKLFFGTDLLNFSLTADDVAITRNFTSLTAAAEEAGQSRIYGGIHWQFDNTAGLVAGAGLGEYIGRNFLQVPGPSAASLGLVLGLAGLRRRR